MTRRQTSAVATDHPAAPALSVPRIPPIDVLRQIVLLRESSTTDLKMRWRELFDREPPPFNRSYLQDRLAYRIQELAHGGLKPGTIARLEALGEKVDGANTILRRIRADNRPITGTRLVREYQGIEHVVTVRDDGFEYEGRPYRSLSGIARAITKTRWNGWTFFGLKAAGGRT
jgi:hypothetical protein